MIHRLEVTLQDTEGAMLRVVGTAERRGFRVRAMHAVIGADALCRMELTLEGSRDAELLGRQLTKLHEVRTATIRVAP